jgi:hypothetical protein
MSPLLQRACLVCLAVACLGPVAGTGQPASPLAGVWTLNRTLSQFPKEFGFTLRGLPPPGGDNEDGTSGGGGGGRGRRGGGNNRSQPSPFAGHPESYEDARRMQLLIAEIRTPPTRLMIVDTPAVVTITNELGQPRTLHPTGRDESVEIQGVMLTAATRRDGDQLVTVYHVEQDRDVRYTYAASPAPGGGPVRLSLDVELLERGKAGDKVTRVYEAGTGSDTAPVATTKAPAAPGPGAPGQTGSQFDQRPGAEFRGLKSLGILVEDLGAEAAACGLNRDALEEALARRLSAGGLTVRKNSDEDTYVYVNIITNSTPGAGCVSRYDAFLYTHATAKLSYREQPVLVQVSLMHRGGIGSSTAAGHAAAVSRGLENYIDLFLTQIRDANK